MGSQGMLEKGRGCIARSSENARDAQTLRSNKTRSTQGTRNLSNLEPTTPSDPQWVFIPLQLVQDQRALEILQVNPGLVKAGTKNHRNYA